MTATTPDHDDQAARVHAALDDAARHVRLPALDVCCVCHEAWPCAEFVFGAMLYAAWRRERTNG